MAKPGFKPDNLSTELELLMTHSAIKHLPKKPTHLSKATSPGSLPSSQLKSKTNSPFKAPLHFFCGYTSIYLSYTVMKEQT